MILHKKQVPHVVPELDCQWPLHVTCNVTNIHEVSGLACDNVSSFHCKQRVIMCIRMCAWMLRLC